MSWRSIEKDPPEMVRILAEYDFSKSDGLLLTDGKNVYAGTLLHYNGGYMFEGYDLGEVTDIDNFEIIRFECGENCQWMPMVSAQPENFTQKVERIISEIRDMIGEKMYYGEMVGAPAPYCHCGPMVYEQPEDYNLEKAADILQGALDGNFLGDPDLMPEETADKTLHELGYEKTESSSGYPMYEDKHGVAIEIAVKADCIAKYHRDPYVPGCVPMTVKEHLAVARLIEETEESK